MKVLVDEDRLEDQDAIAWASSRVFHETMNAPGEESEERGNSLEPALATLPGAPGSFDYFESPVTLAPTGIQSRFPIQTGSCLQEYPSGDVNLSARRASFGMTV